MEFGKIINCFTVTAIMVLLVTALISACVTVAFRAERNLNNSIKYSSYFFEYGLKKDLTEKSCTQNLSINC